MLIGQHSRIVSLIRCVLIFIVNSTEHDDDGLTSSHCWAGAYNIALLSIKSLTSNFLGRIKRKGDLAIDGLPSVVCIPRVIELDKAIFQTHLQCLRERSANQVRLNRNFSTQQQNTPADLVLLELSDCTL